MKVRSGMIQRHVMDSDIVIDVTGKFSGVVKLNGTSAEIWSEIAAGKAPEEIAANLAEMYEVSLEKVKSDVDAFCKDMLKQGFFEV